MPTPDECKAQYEAALGPNPTPLRQVQCSFQYAQCLLAHAQGHAAAHIQSLTAAAPAEPTRSKPARPRAKATPKRGRGT